MKLAGFRALFLFLLWQRTPASSECVQSLFSIPLCVQLRMLLSSPTHCTLSRTIGPEPPPNAALVYGTASVQGIAYSANSHKQAFALLHIYTIRLLNPFSWTLVSFHYPFLFESVFTISTYVCIFDFSTSLPVFIFICFCILHISTDEYIYRLYIPILLF